MSLSYAYISINIISLAAIIAAITAVMIGRDKESRREILLVLTCIFIGSFAIFMESAVSGYEKKLLWRNLSQIGLFLLPSASFNFVMVYTGTKSRFLNVIRRINFIYASICVLLIFTNDLHHIMRLSVDFIENDIGMVLRVRQTITGKICVALNTLMSLTSLIRLWVFMRASSKSFRPQVRMIFVGFLIPIIFTYTRSAILTALGILIPTPLSFLVGILFILWGMYRYDFLAVSPIARDWIIDEINIGMILTRPDGKVADVNRWVLEQFNGNMNIVNEFIESNIGWKNALSGHSDSQFEIKWNRDRELKTYSVQVHELIKHNHPVGSVSMLRDITIEKHTQKNLQRRADTDGMTKVLNREAFERRIISILNDYQESEKHCSMFILDIDNFKHINDSYGHPVGDEVIKEIVTIISSISRQKDYVGRLGGDEFALFLFDAEREPSEKIAERINSTIRRREFFTGGKSFNASISIGIINTPMAGISFDQLYARADKALFKAKEGGRNRYCVFNP